MALPEAPFDDPALTPAGERLLDAASELFYRRGIRAVGVDLVAETAGTTKKTLYDRFGSKDELVALYLRRRARRWQAFLFPYLQGIRSGPASSPCSTPSPHGCVSRGAAAPSSTRTPRWVAPVIRPSR